MGMPKGSWEPCRLLEIQSVFAVHGREVMACSGAVFVNLCLTFR